MKKKRRVVFRRLSKNIFKKYEIELQEFRACFAPISKINGITQFWEATKVHLNHEVLTNYTKFSTKWKGKRGIFSSFQGEFNPNSSNKIATSNFCNGDWARVSRDIQLILQSFQKDLLRAIRNSLKALN